MSPEVISIVVLGALFVLATWRNVHLGAAALAAAWLVGLFVFQVTTGDVLAGFPADLFMTLVGVTFLFGIAERTGVITALVYWAFRAVGGRVAWMPWVIFFVTAAITAVGAATPAAAAIVGPIAMGFAARHRTSPILMGMAVIQGASAGSFAPTGVYGMIINEILVRNGLGSSPFVLFFASLAAILLTVVIAYFMYGGRRRRQAANGGDLARDGSGTLTATGNPGNPVETTDSDLAAPVMSGPLIASLIAVIGLVVLVAVDVAVGFGMHLGFVALILVVVLATIFPDAAKGAVGAVAWPTTLLVCGVVTYVALLQNQGVVDWLGNWVAGIGAPLLAALAICFIAAIVSALASTTGILTALVPLAVPFLLTGHVWVAGLIAALAISASVVDCSPFSTNGALMVAYASDERRDYAYRHFLGWGGGTVLLAPIVSWFLLIVLPGVIIRS